MKKIIYTRSDGGLSVFNPCEGARLATCIKDEKGDVLALSTTAIPIDRFFRRWPVDGAVAEWAETEDEFIARVAARSVPADAADVQVVEPEVIPTDRTFRNAWKVGDERVEHDMQKCKEIAHERRRVRRAEEFAPLDIEATIPAKAAQAEAKRQAIRDKYDAIQSAIDAARSVEELKATLT